MTQHLRILGIAILCALVVAACGSEERRSEPETTTAGDVELPTAVVEKRDAIVAASQTFDYDRLATLLDPAEFSYSFGESGDPIGYWRRLERDGHVPIIGDYLPVILKGPSAKRGEIYVWPSVYGKQPSRWTTEERRWLRNNLYSEAEIRAFERVGDYLGWRVGIRDDGKWLFFVSGD